MPTGSSPPSPTRPRPRIVHSTSRRDDSRAALEMLLGFGWQWTTDRFDEEERRYSRFADGTCPIAFERPLKERTGLATVAPVHDYVSNRAIRHGYFTLRGAPDLIGGHGLTTRRFAANPMRGYPNVTFRWIVRPA